MIFFVIHDEDGRILRTGSCDEASLPYQAQAGETALETVDQVDDSKYYVDDGIITLMPTIPSMATWNKTSIFANGIDAATIGNGLPNPTTVTMDVPQGALPIEPFAVTDGSLSFTAQLPGDYTLYFSAFRTQPYSVTITAE